MKHIAPGSYAVVDDAHSRLNLTVVTRVAASTSCGTPRPSMSR
jgi:hypothetical protein